MLRTEVEREYGPLLGLLGKPECNTGQGTWKKYGGVHDDAKYRVVQGKGSQSDWVICWNCASREQQEAIKRAGGGSRW